MGDEDAGAESRSRWSRAESDAAFALRLEAWQTTKSTFEAAALISGEIVATAVADDDASPWLVWTPVENFVGLDVPLVVMAGFDPMAERNKPRSYGAVKSATRSRTWR